MAHVYINTKIGTISLQELCSKKYNYNFIIPTYQRGYRWRTKHVQALIDDLTSSKTYCLQPIVLQENKNGGSHGRCMGRGAQVSCSTFRNWVQGLKFSYTFLKLR